MRSIVLQSNGHLHDEVRAYLMRKVRDDIVDGRVDSSARLLSEWSDFCSTEAKKNSRRGLINMTGLLSSHAFFLIMGFAHSSWSMVGIACFLICVLLYGRNHYVTRALRIGRAMHVARDALMYPVEPIAVQEGDDPCLVSYLNSQSEITAAQHDGVALYRRSSANTQLIGCPM